MEQTSRRSCLDDSPLANANIKEGRKEDISDACCKQLQSKDLLPTLPDPAAFPVPHEPISASAAFDGPTPDLKFETPMSLHGGDNREAVGNLDAPIIRLDGTSGLSLRL